MILCNLFKKRGIIIIDYIALFLCQNKIKDIIAGRLINCIKKLAGPNTIPALYAASRCPAFIITIPNHLPAIYVITLTTEYRFARAATSGIIMVSQKSRIKSTLQWAKIGLQDLRKQENNSSNATRSAIIKIRF